MAKMRVAGQRDPGLVEFALEQENEDVNIKANGSIIAFFREGRLFLMNGVPEGLVEDDSGFIQIEEL